jgi:ketosteroid isomerase-like protein
MTAEAAAVVRKLFGAVADRDFERVRSCFAPDIVWFGTRGGIDETQVLRGADAAIRYVAEIEDSWQRYDVELERIVEVGDVLVGYLRESARARHAELELQRETAMVFTVRDGKLASATGYLDRDEALSAARGQRS